MQPAKPYIFLPAALLLAAGSACVSTPFSDDGFNRGGRNGEGPCEIAGASNYLLPAGFLDSSPEGGNAAHWRCIIERDTDARPRFEGWTGNTLVVNGGSTSLDLEFDLGNDEAGEPLPFENRGVIVGVVGELGYFYRPATTLEDVLTMDLVFSPTIAQSRFTIFVALDSAEGNAAEIAPGAYLEIPMDVVQVESGELQVSLSWDTDADMNLFVTEPDGTRIFYSDPESASGAVMDLDSNGLCQEPYNQNESIHWPQGTASSGEYTIELFQDDPCETAGRTHWRVTVLAGGVATLYAGSLNPDDLEGVTVGTFNWTGSQ